MIQDQKVSYPEQPMASVALAPDRVVIDASGKKLARIIAELMARPHAVALLPRGLRLTWDRADITETTDIAHFAITRPAPNAPSELEIDTVVKHAAGKIDLSAAHGAAWSERVERGGRSALWHGLRWQLVVQEGML